MKVFCLIDSLNSGGAQRQICMLAKLLSDRGHEVILCTYHDYVFYADLLKDTDIKFVSIPPQNKFKRTMSIIRIIKDTCPDLVVSYLNTPNLVAELANFPCRRFPLVVSERNVYPNGINFKILFRLNAHRLADRVVSNSYAQQQFLKDKASYLSSKTVTIQNCVDLDRFKPAETTESFRRNTLVVVGRFEPQKNPFRLIKSLAMIIPEDPNCELRIEWYGNNFFERGEKTEKSTTYLQARKLISEKSLGGRFQVFPQQQDIENVYRSASAVCLPSLWEGCSNVVCEAMSCGKPVLTSDVGDNSLLVKDGVNGFIFDPKSPVDMARAIRRFLALDYVQRVEMGKKSRERAKEMLSSKLFIDKYLALFNDLIEERRHVRKNSYDFKGG